MQKKRYFILMVVSSFLAVVYAELSLEAASEKKEKLNVYQKPTEEEISKRLTPMITNCPEFTSTSYPENRCSVQPTNMTPEPDGLLFGSQLRKPGL